MMKRVFATTLLAAALANSLVGVASATLILYEPFNYAEDRFLVNTPVGTPASTTSPIGYLAPNNNNWYGTGVAGNHAVVNDGQVTNVDLSYPGLAKPGVNRSLTLGGTGHTMRLSLNTSIGSPNQTGPNATDTPDPLAGTDGTLQSTDTAGTGYYSMIIRVTDVTGLNATGGILAGFNSLINAQTGNPATVGAGLAIRPIAGGFELGVVDQGSSGFTSATYDGITRLINTDIFVVGKYQTVGAQGNPTPAETNDTATLWVNPAAATFGGFDPAGGIFNNSGNNDIPTNASTNNHTLQSFLLRQTGTTVNNQVPPGVIFDELRVGTNYADVTPVVPEPASLVLAGLGLIAGLATRRRTVAGA